MASNIPSVHLSSRWDDLPKEMECMILEMVTWPASSDAETTQELAPFTTVCRDWQAFFEAKTFQRIILQNESRVSQFAQLVQGERRKLVEWIWLRLELPQYDCTQCCLPESDQEVQVQNRDFTNLVWAAFETLASWKTEESGRRGITLELSAHSPSDAIHFNKDLNFRIHDKAWDRWDARPVPHHDDPSHHWQDGRQIEQIPLDAKTRVFGRRSGLCFDLDAPIVHRLQGQLPGQPWTGQVGLPKVSVVDSLVIRRQFHRAFSVSPVLRRIFDGLTRLANFTYEPWRRPTSRAGAVWGEEHTLAIYNMLRFKRTLKTVSIFENFDDVFYPQDLVGLEPYRHSNDVYLFLALASRHMEELYVSNNCDARDFFHHFWPTVTPKSNGFMVWPNLKNLSLTSMSLEPDFYNLLITTAAKAAERMPRLEVMEIWHYGEGEACIFRFERSESHAEIELKSTWPAAVSASAEAAWARVAGPRRSLGIKNVRLDEKLITGAYAVLPLMALTGRLLHPVSRRQIEREDERRRYSASLP